MFKQKASTIIKSNGTNETYLLPLLKFPQISCSKLEEIETNQTLLKVDRAGAERTFIVVARIEKYCYKYYY